jgi:hypothetical protein
VQDLTHAADKAERDAHYSEAWLDLAMRIPFAADDPLAWTTEQRRALFSPFPEGANRALPTYVGWKALTPSQRAVIPTLVTDYLRLPDLATGEGDYKEHTLTAAEMEKAGIPDKARVELSVDLGDGKWVRTRGWRELSRSLLHALRDQARNREKRKLQDGTTRPIALQNRYYPDRNLMPARNRALMVPVLSIPQLNKLAIQMQVRGIKTLFYPLLQEGYATFPSDAFPAHPALDVANGWDACVTAMKVAGVTVIGYMETLTWRKPGQTPHWLDQHPGYLDVDILGRSLGEHLAAEASLRELPAPELTGDLVRATEPEVQSRLETLLSEYLRQPGVSGLCLDAWSTGTACIRGARGAWAGQWYGPGYELGFAVPDRLASILKDSRDPVDQDGLMPGFESPPLAAPKRPTPSSSVDTMPAPPIAPQPPFDEITLVTRLLSKTLPDGRALLTFATDGYGTNSGNGRPKGGAGSLPATVLLNPVYGSDSNTVPRCLLIRVPKRDKASAAVASGSSIAPNAPAMILAEGGYYNPPNRVPANWVVYDFRGAPEEIDDSLRRVGMPADAASPK